MQWQIGQTWTKFLYPFLFANRFKPEVEACGTEFAEVLISDPSLDGVWVEKQFEAQELENMLPYVKQYLQLSSNHRRFQVDFSCLSPESIFTLINEDSPDFKIVQKQVPLFFQITHIEMYVFFNGVGCMVVEVQPLSMTGSPLLIEEIERLNSRLASLVNGGTFQKVASALATSSSEKSFLNSITPEAIDPVQWNLADICQKQSHLTIKLLLDGLLKSFHSKESILSVTPMVDRFLPVYGALLLRPNQDISIEELDEHFHEFAQRHLTILRKTFSPNHISQFSKIHLNDSEHHYIPYHNVIHSQSLDGGFVLSYDNGLSHFSGAKSPAMESFRTGYFYMMLIPFHQRLSILRYAMGAANSGLSPERGAQLRKLREEIYDFTSRCYFSQASVSEERDCIYRRWQSAFHVAQMYNELKEEIHDIDNYLESLERERQNELQHLALRHDSQNMGLFNLITLVFLPITILIQTIPDIPVLYGWIHNAKSPILSILIVGSMFVFIGFILSFLLRMFKKRIAKSP